MKLVKYYKDNCPGCDLLKLVAKSEGVTFDQEVHAIDELSAADRRAMKLMSVPTVILFDDNGAEVARMSGPDRDKLRELVEMRGAK